MDFRTFESDFLTFTGDIVYCTVTTVDTKRRPRSRIMHPIFEVVDGDPRGWAVTDRSPVKSRHIAGNPYVACSYWSPAQNTVALDCTASWVDDTDVRRYVWDLFSSPEPPGWGDMSGYGAAGIQHPQFQILALTPWRIQILRGEQFAAGDLVPRVWRRD